MPFHDHLRPDQNIRVPVCKSCQYFLIVILFFRCIRIHPQNARLREPQPQAVLYLLCSRLKAEQISALTFGTNRRLRLFIATIMADHFLPVLGKGNITVWTFHDITACPAGYKARNTSTVQKQHNLLPLFQPVSDRSFQMSAEDRTVAAC